MSNGNAKGLSYFRSWYKSLLPCSCLPSADSEFLWGRDFDLSILGTWLAAS